MNVLDSINGAYVTLTDIMKNLGVSKQTVKRWFKGDGMEKYNGEYYVEIDTFFEYITEYMDGKYFEKLCEDLGIDVNLYEEDEVDAFAADAIVAVINAFDICVHRDALIEDDDDRYYMDLVCPMTIKLRIV